MIVAGSVALKMKDWDKAVDAEQQIDEGMSGSEEGDFEDW